MRAIRRAVVAVVTILIGLLYLQCAPANYNLAEPLDLTDKPTFVTEWKLQFANTDQCYAALQNAGVEIERLPDEVKGPGCEFEGVGRLDQSLATWGKDVTLTCPMLAGVALWERHALQPLAQEMLGSRVAQVRHYGTYSCRNINNERNGRRSEHATANAFDIAGFVLANGEEVSVLRDWGKRSPKGRFLDRIHDRACDHFNAVLGPDYNTLHRDHFHFDQGSYETCS